MRKGLLWGFVSTLFIACFAVGILDALKGHMAGGDGSFYPRNLATLLSFLETLDFVPVEWFMRYFELGTWPSWINWLLTFFEVLMTLVNYVTSLVLLAFQCLVYILGIINWVFM